MNNYDGIGIPAGMESDEDIDQDDDMVPDFIAEQFGHHGWNVNNMAHLFDGLDLAEFDIDDDDFLDDDDDEWFDEYYDSDFDYEDNEDRRKYVTGIFKTLEDSQVVLDKLAFHRDSSKEAGSRLPRIFAGQTETYETLHKLLEEIELLLKVWKNRVNHPLTAHLERKVEDRQVLEDEPDLPGNGHGLVMGTDYHESDVESDTTDHRYDFRSKDNVNMMLTRKKFCQSTKMFYTIFTSDLEFEALQGQIKAMKKHIFNVAFSLFLQNVPQDLMPLELWEKIWRMTICDGPDLPPIHSSGVREKASRKWTLFENERITDCFGAAGNLHMILFEVLYKHPYILTNPQMLEMETTGNLAKFKYFRLYFFKFAKLLKMKFSRLELLDQDKYKAIDEIEDMSTMSVPKRIEQGQFHITHHSVMLNPKEKIPNNRALFMIFTKTPSPFVATLHNVKEKVTISLWNMVKDKLVTTIKSGLDTYKVCLESTQNDRRFSLTTEQFSLLSDYDRENHELDFHKWMLDLSSSQSTSAKVQPTKSSLIIDLNIEEESGLSTSLNLMTTKKFHIVQVKRCLEWLVDKTCTFIVLDALAQQPVVLKRISMPSLSAGIACVRDYTPNEYFLLHHYNNDPIHSADNKIWFYHLEQDKQIADYKMSDIYEMTNQACPPSESSPAADENNQQAAALCNYDAKFDFLQHQFVIVKEFISSFVIYRYDPNSLNKPQMVHKGSMFCHVNAKFFLMNGLIFGTCQKEDETMPRLPDSLATAEDIDSIEIICADLHAKQSHTIVTIGANASSNANMLLNETHRTIMYAPYDAFLSWPGLQPLNDKVMVLQAEKSSYIKLDLGLSPHQIAQFEAKAMYSKQMVMEKKLKAKHDLVKQKKERKAKDAANKAKMAQKYLNSCNHHVQGPIHSWRGCWGFMKPKGEAKALESLFVHYSNIIDAPSKKSIRNGTWIQAKVSKDQNHDGYMAIDIKIIPKPSNTSSESRRSSQPSHSSQPSSSSSNAVAALQK